MYKYNAIIRNVVDGDTFDLDIDLGFHIHIHERVRLLDIDCPEKTARNGEDEKKAGKFITNWVYHNLCFQSVRITSYKGTDSFGRWLVDLEADFGDGFTNVKHTYDAKGFNKLAENYSLDRLLKEIEDYEKVEEERCF